MCHFCFVCLVFLSLKKGGNVSQSLKKVLWGPFWISDLITAMNSWVIRVWAGLSREPVHHILSALLCELCLWSPVSLAHIKLPRKNLGYLGFLVSPLGILFHFVLCHFFILAKSVWRYLKLPLMSNWAKKHEKKQTAVPKGKKKAPPWLLKSPKTPSLNWAWLVDSRAKRHPFNG